MKKICALGFILSLCITLFGCSGGNVETSSVNSTSAASAASSKSTSSSGAGISTDANVVYRNTEYGFNFTLPESWKGYTVVVGKWEGRALQGAKGGEVVETGPLLSIRHPEWTAEKPRQDIPIMVFTPAQWTQVENEELSMGAAPIGPSMLGSNSKHVFALPARYNYAFLEGYEEVDEILQNHSLQAVEIGD